MFSSESYPRQYLISLHAHQAPPTWNQLVSEGVHFSRAVGLPLTTVTVKGESKAWILGWYSDTVRWGCEDSVLTLKDEQSWERKKWEMAGRFVLVERNSGRFEIRTDAGGLMPVVFDSATAAVASSPSVIRRIRNVKANKRIVQDVQRFDATVWYPFGILPFQGMSRLLPNQALDLASFEIRLDRKAAASASLGTTELIDSISGEVARHVETIASHGPMGVHLTAGRDSRMVLAAALQSGADFECETIAMQTAAARVDLEQAKRLAGLCDKAHRALPFVPPSDAELSAWRERTGFCVEDAVTSLCRTVVAHDVGRFTLTGTGGEVGRAFYWERQDLKSRGIEIRQLIVRMGFRPSSYLEEQAEHWIAQFPASCETVEILDAAYIDNRLCCWAGPSAVGHLLEKPTISPFNSRKIYSEMMTLPADFRWKQLFPVEFIERFMPELLSIPFNRASGLARLRDVKGEIRAILPASMKRILKRIRNGA